MLDYFVIAEGIFATLPRTTRGAAIVLGGDPKGKNFLYCNGNSVVIRDVEVGSRSHIDALAKSLVYLQDWLKC